MWQTIGEAGIKRTHVSFALLSVTSALSCMYCATCHAQAASTEYADLMQLDKASVPIAMPISVDIEMICPWMGWYVSGAPFDFRLNNAKLLLGRNDVRRELRISLSQQNQIDELTKHLAETVNRKYEDAVKSGLGGSSESPPGLQAAVKKDSAAIFGKMMFNMVRTIRDAILPEEIEFDHKIELLLTPHQLSRLRELDLQWRGPLALADPGVAVRADLNAFQKVLVENTLRRYETDLCTESNTKYLRTVTPEDQAASTLENDVAEKLLNKVRVETLLSSEMRHKRVRAETDVRDVLSDDQRTTWNKMIGKNFVFRSQ